MLKLVQYIRKSLRVTGIMILPSDIETDRGYVTTRTIVKNLLEVSGVNSDFVVRLQSGVVMTLVHV